MDLEPETGREYHVLGKAIVVKKISLPYRYPAAHQGDEIVMVELARDIGQYEKGFQFECKTKALRPFLSEVKR